MDALNLPTADVKIKDEGGTAKIFDIIRRKWVALSPEEWVRQHFIHFLVHQKGYPASLMRTEAGHAWNRQRHRSDIVVYNKEGRPRMVVECKSPKVKITQRAFDQAARYNMALQVPLLVVTNGLQHFCCAIDHGKKQYAFLKEVPQNSEGD